MRSTPPGLRAPFLIWLQDFSPSPEPESATNPPTDEDEDEEPLAVPSAGKGAVALRLVDYEDAE